MSGGAVAAGVLQGVGGIMSAGSGPISSNGERLLDVKLVLLSPFSSSIISIRILLTKGLELFI